MFQSKVFIIVFIGLFSFALKAQDGGELRLDFVKYELNQIEYYGDSTALDHFYAKFHKVVEQREGQVNIIHFGGSHLQADIWSNQLRRRFLALRDSISPGRGLVFPYSLARSNNPWNIQIEKTGRWEGCKNTLEGEYCDLGLLGYSATTYDSGASFTFINRKTDSIDFSFNNVKVYHVFDSSQFRLVTDEKSKKVMNPSLGYTEFKFDNYLDTITFRFIKTGNEQKNFTLLGLNLTSDRPGIYYHAIGVNGADVPDHLRSNRLEQHLKSVVPDLVVFSIGINDAYHPGFNSYDYKKNYKELIDKIKSVAPDVSILFTTNNDSYYKRHKPNERGEVVKKAMQELSEELNAGVWDMFSVMGGLGSIDIWVERQLAKTDRIHFKADGYRVIGDLMFVALMKDFEKYHKRND